MKNNAKKISSEEIERLGIFNPTRKELEKRIEQSERDFKEKKFVNAHALLQKYK